MDSVVGDMEGNGTRLTETDIGAVENEGGGAEGSRGGPIARTATTTTQTATATS